MTRNVIWVNIALVILHTISVIVHAVAHGILDVNMSVVDDGFIVLVIMITPIVAVVLLGTSHQRLGAVMLGLSMFGACVYGVYNHFIAQGIDNVSQVSMEFWGTVFRVTAVLLAIVEGLGSVTALWAVKQIISGETRNATR